MISFRKSVVHLDFHDSTLISAAEVSVRQQRGTSSCLIFHSSQSNPILADSTYGGSLQIPRKFETERLEIMGESLTVPIISPAPLAQMIGVTTPACLEQRVLPNGR